MAMECLLLITTLPMDILLCTIISILLIMKKVPKCLIQEKNRKKKTTKNHHMTIRCTILGHIHTICSHLQFRLSLNKVHKIEGEKALYQILLLLKHPIPFLLQTKNHHLQILILEEQTSTSIFLCICILHTCLLQDIL